MLIALPSRHEAVADALAAEGFNVVHVDEHIRAFLTELDPPISATPVFANMAGSPRLADQLDERRKSLFRWQQAPGARVDVVGDHRVTVSRIVDGEVQSVDHDLFDDCIERNAELRRMVAALRRMLPAPDFTALEGDTVVTGVDRDAQRALLPDAVRCVAVAGRIPPWATDAGAALVTIDADLSPDGQAAAAVEVVRGLVPA